MYIKFANTAGSIYDYQRSALDSDYDLGSMLTYNDGIVIVDRYPSQEITQVDVDSTIKSLRYILKNLYPLQTNDISIFLPRMDANISKQAEIQSKFAKMTVTGGDIINYFNITLIHV